MRVERVLASFLFGFLIAIPMSFGGVESLPVKSSISNVILYRSQALITRTVQLPDKTGELALTIEDLPASVVPDSLFASSKGDLKIRSVRYLTELLPAKEPDNEIVKLEEKIQQLLVDRQTLETKAQLINEKKMYIQKIQQQYISKLGPTKTALTDKDVAVAGFDFATIDKMTVFLFKQQELITQEVLALAKSRRDIDKKVKTTQAELDALRHGFNAPNQQDQVDLSSQKVKRKAIIYVAQSKANTKGNLLLLNYLVHSTGWSPAYNMRLNREEDMLNIEYLAHVYQTSGEDWNGVALTLSTATPNMNAEIPILTPMWVHLTQSEHEKQPPVPDDNLMAQTIQSQIGTNSMYRQKKSAGNYIEFNYSLNKGAWDRQKLEFQNRKETLRRWYAGVRKIEQQIAVEYDIPDHVTLASRNDKQMVVILSKDLPCKMFYEAVPLLAGYVSRGLEADYTIDQPLLAGSYSAFIAGQYVGSGQVPVTVTGQTLILGFGTDPQLHCRRELLDKIADKSWGSRTETYKYALTLDNYKSKPVTVRLLDRIPVSKDKGLEIKLLKGKEELCKDGDDPEADLRKGILRWDIQLPPSTSGSKATKFEYSFDMTFDSDMQISDQMRQIQEQIRHDLIKMKAKRARQ